MITSLYTSGLTCLPARKVRSPSFQRRQNFVVSAQLSTESRPEPVTLLGLASFMVVDAANAESAPVVDSVVSSTVTTVQKSGDAVKTGLDYFGRFIEAAREVYDTAAPVVKDTYVKVAPVLEKGVKTTVEVVGPAVEKSLPVVKDSVSGLLSRTGVDTTTITKTTSVATDAAGKAVNIATPTVNKAVEFVSTSDPVTLVKYGVAVGAIYFILPYLLGGVGGAIRGYAGDVSPTQALDTIMTDGKAFLLDVRSLREKDSSGIPDVPGSASGRFIEVPIATTENKRVRGMLRNADGVEQQVTAMLISSLKRLDRGCTLFLLDRNGGTSRAIAKQLAGMGFGKAFVVSGGYEGWTRCKLQTKPSMSVSVVQPAFGTMSIARRALPK